MNDDAPPYWVRLGLTDLTTRTRAAWLRNVGAAFGAVMVLAGLVEPQAALMSTAFFAATAWIHTSMLWMDAHDAW